MKSNTLVQQRLVQHRPLPAPVASYSSLKRRSLPVVNVLEKDEPKLAESLAQESSAQLEAALLPPSLSRSSKIKKPISSLVAPDGDVLYFAYGANLNLPTLSRRGVSTPPLRSPSVVCDPSVKLVFKHRGGYSTLQQMQAGEQPKFNTYLEQVHGVLYQLSKEDLQKLAKKEGGYQLVDIEVETYDGWRATAKTFVSGPLAQLHAEVVPTERYMKQLRDGAADNYLDPLYQAWLSSIETVPSVGLPAEYWDTPAKYIAYSFLAVVGLLVASFFVQQ